MTVSTPVITVMIVCNRMMVANPSTPPPTISAAMTRNAITLVTSPPPQPSRWNTVAVASVASAVSTISQPTHKIQETIDGSLLPRTPNAARDRVRVRARPRLAGDGTDPAQQERHPDPDQACHRRLPERDAEPEHEGAVAEPQHRDVGREPRPEQLPRPPAPFVLSDHVDAVDFDAPGSGLRFRAHRHA